MSKIEIRVAGMTCMSCLSKVEKALYSLSGVDQVDLDLDSGEGSISGTTLPEEDQLTKAVATAGNYTLSFDKNSIDAGVSSEAEGNSSYKPLAIVVLYLVLVTVVIELSSGMFLLDTWMANFMAGFFLVFSFFKMLDLKGFANAYQGYDIIARKWKLYGFIYPFIELGLGLAYLIYPDIAITHLITAIVMFVSLIGVVEAVSNKRKILCVCLGTGFNLPMSTVTIIEDGVMLIMALFMYFKM